MAVRIIQQGQDILLKTRPSITPMLVAFHACALGLLFYSALEGFVVGCIVSGFFLLPMSIRAAFPSAVALRTEAGAIEILGGFLGFKSLGIYSNTEIRCVKVQAEAGAELPGPHIIPKLIGPHLWLRTVARQEKALSPAFKICTGSMWNEQSGSSRPSQT
jgi:hypothetical protein